MLNIESGNGGRAGGKNKVVLDYEEVAAGDEEWPQIRKKKKTD